MTPSEQDGGSPEEALASLLDSIQPGSLVAGGKLAQRLAVHWCRHNPDTHLLTLETGNLAAAFPLARTPDLVLLTETLEQLDKESGTLLLGQLRNYGSHQIAVLVGAQAQWHRNDFIALGFLQQAHFAGPPQQQLYSYNLDAYNFKRRWNSPEHWANPEMWGKSWW
ncbi:MAG: DUF6231 family protein [Marinobacter sp.]|nr:DUF6231 family protein [Marinobacter sp.]